MTLCTFGEFYSECLDRLTDSQLRALDPDADYFRLTGGYCGLYVEPERIWVSILVGDVHAARELKTALYKSKAPLIGWACRPGSPMHSWAKYYGARIEESGQKYADGVPELRCVVSTIRNIRLTKVREESQALT